MISDLAVRLAVAAPFGGPIGSERERPMWAPGVHSVDVGKAKEV